jgi:hypothetical protein
VLNILLLLVHDCGSLTAGVFGDCRTYKLSVAVWLFLLHSHIFAVVLRKSCSLKITSEIKVKQRTGTYIIYKYDNENYLKVFNFYYQPYALIY